MRKCILLLAVGALALATTALGGNGNIKPLPPQAAAAAASAPGRVALGTVRRVSPAVALAASHQAGADTEVAPGLTPAQAVGIAPVAVNSTVRPARTTRTAGFTICWNAIAAGYWGQWPYAGEVDNNSYWCGNGVTISYRTTHVILSGEGGLCGTHDPYGFKSAGGVGYYYEQETAGGYFDCPTYVPWITLHYNHHFDFVVFADGGSYTTNQSG